MRDLLPLPRCPMFVRIRILRIFLRIFLIPTLSRLGENAGQLIPHSQAPVIKWLTTTSKMFRPPAQGCDCSELPWVMDDTARCINPEGSVPAAIPSCSSQRKNGHQQCRRCIHRFVLGLLLQEVVDDMEFDKHEDGVRQILLYYILIVLPHIAPRPPYLQKNSLTASLKKGTQGLLCPICNTRQNRLLLQVVHFRQVRLPFLSVHLIDTDIEKCSKPYSTAFITAVSPVIH